jgi:hypothetical protein
LIRELEPHGPARLLLADGRAVHGISAWRHVVDTQSDHVTTAQFTVYREVEEGKVALAPRHLQLRPYRPDVARPQRRLGTDELALVPGLAARRPQILNFMIVFHGLSPCFEKQASMRPQGSEGPISRPLWSTFFLGLVIICRF